MRRLQKLQIKRMEAYTAGEDLPARSEKTYEKARAELVALVQKVHLHNNRIEELVEQLKQLNRKLTALEGQVLRMAESQQGEARGVPAALARLASWTRPGSSALAKLPGKALEDLRRPLARRRGGGARADRRRSPTTPACRSASSAASTPPSRAASAT